MSCGSIGATGAFPVCASLAAEPGCSLLEHDLLAWLAAAPSCRSRMLDLADQLAVARGGLTRIVDRFVERGWIERDRPEANRREVYAVLTAEGRAILSAARAVYSRVLKETLGAHLDERDLSDLARITGKLLDAMG
ncbi:MarR family winged helix-turn-helix transcriptional regulator [Nonomuraea mangrovi]|uniref:MarR family winged helix-turn-helix transcriptional regulator n=2 Tax=Nonomuraea TaxID=83681 RepID=A0ABW4SY53_9ACTN